MSRLRATVLASGLVAACVAGEVEPPPGEASHTGAVQFGLTLSPGMEVREVSYRLSAPSLGLTPRQGVLDVSAPGGTPSALFGGLPAGAGYQIDLSTTTVGGAMTCSGDAAFAVIAGQTTVVEVAFDCRRSDGTVSIDLAINNCPRFTALVVSPRAPDGTIAVGVAIAEADPGDHVRYDWSARTGSYRDARSAATSFTCPAASTVPIPGTVRITDGQCSAEAAFELECGAPAMSAADVAPLVTRQALTITAGVELDELSYRLSGNGIAPREGTIDLRRSPGGTSFTLPSGDGYRLALTGVSTDGQTTCRGEQVFVVTPGGQARVAVALQCQRRPATGAVDVRTTFNQCPVARISEVDRSGGVVWLSAAASDAEASALTFVWSADRGQFRDPGSRSPYYHCAGAGTVLVRLAVSDGSCETVVYQEVRC